MATNDLSMLTQNPEMLGLERQRQMAQMLLKQGMQAPQSQMVGDRYVPVNPMQYIGNLFSAYAGQKGLEAADQKELALAKALREKKLAETTDIMQSLTGTPEQATELAGPAYNGVAPQAVMPAVPGSPQEALAKALKSETGAGNMLLPSIIENVLPKKTQEIINWEAEKANGYKGTLSEFKNQMNDYQKEELKLSKQRLGLEGAKFNLEQQKAAQELQYGKPLNEAQAKAAVFHSQMVSASNELGNVYSKGFNPNSPTAQAQTSMAGGFLNAITPSDAQQAKQAQNQWTEAYLRFKTGAGTNAHEVEANRQTYFPQIGDKPEQIAQKSRMRAQAEQDIAMAAGPHGGRMGAQSTTANPVVIPSSQSTSKNVTPSLWGEAIVVGK